ncbi:hypothetical protein ACHAXT_009930 [Thalassiosira profunda]
MLLVDLDRTTMFGATNMHVGIICNQHTCSHLNRQTNMRYRSNSRGTPGISAAAGQLDSLAVLQLQLCTHQPTQGDWNGGGRHTIPSLPQLNNRLSCIYGRIGGGGARRRGRSSCPVCETVAGHRAQFYAEAAKHFEGGDHTTYPISEDLHSKIFALFAKAFKQGTTLKDLREQYGGGSVDKWKKKYDVLIIGSEETLIYRPGEDENGNLPALDQHKEVLHRGNVFDKILAVHNGTDGSAAKGHRKARTLHNAVKEKYGRSVPQWATQLLGDTCPVCIMKASRKKPKAGSQPIITRGFNTRGQMDLIDMQSMPDGNFKYIFVYQCHGSKLTFLESIVTKEIKVVAYVLFVVFTLIGPPAILQADNGREFNGAAFRGRKVEISDEFIDGVITELKQLWPDCRLVRGLPRASETNGGVERRNRTVEEKLGNWMNETGSTRWSVGIKLVQWECNTQIHRGIGNKVPYHLVFGQKPRVGISRLPLGTELLDSLHTEAQLSAVFNVAEGVPLEDAIVQAQVANANAIAGSSTPALPAPAAAVDSALAGIAAGPIAGAAVAPGAASIAAVTASTASASAATAGNSLFQSMSDGGTIDDFTHAALLDIEGDPNGETADGYDEQPAASPAPGHNDADVEGYGEKPAAVPAPDSEARKQSAAESLRSLSRDSSSAGANLSLERVESPEVEDGGDPIDNTKPFIVASDEDIDDCSNAQLLWLSVLGNTFRPVTGDILRDAKLRSRFAIVAKENESGSIWRRVVVERKRKDTWQVMDEMGDGNLDTIDCGEEGFFPEWGASYRHPTAMDFARAKEAAKKRKDLHDQREQDLDESPRRKKMRDDAVEAMQRNGRAMKERVEKVEGELEVGSVVQVPLHDVDTTKVDGKTLTLVVVQKRQLKNDNAPKYKLACAKGPLKNYRIISVPLGSAASLGLTNVLTAWEGMAPITERAAAASVSLVGGQGKKFCGCRGKCNNRQCCCKKAGRLCNSHCHGGVHNKNCKNCG